MTADSTIRAAMEAKDYICMCDNYLWHWVITHTCVIYIVHMCMLQLLQYMYFWWIIDRKSDIINEQLIINEFR